MKPLKINNLYFNMMMIWAGQSLRLEFLLLLTAPLQCRLLGCGGQIFFGGVFELLGRLKDGFSKTVTKNMWAGFSKTHHRPPPPKENLFSLKLKITIQG